MKRLIPFLTMMSFALALSGCTANYKNISSEPGFSQYIGQTYMLSYDMGMRGVNLPPGYSDKIDEYILGKLYKIQHKAPEEISLTVIPKGSTFTISGVYECTNCLSLPKLRKVSITINNLEKAVDAPITMPIHEIESKENFALLK